MLGNKRHDERRSEGDDSWAKTPEGILVDIKNKLLAKTGTTPVGLSNLVSEFVSNIFMGKVNTKTHFAKVNICNELGKKKMTMKVFYKFLKIIKARSVVFTVKVITVDGTPVVVESTVNMSSYSPTKEENTVD